MTMGFATTPEEVLGFWFDPATKPKWFNGGAAFDDEVRAVLGPALEAGARGDLARWKGDRDGALAVVLLFDQVPRNIFRGSARAFAHDAEARRIARIALARGWDLELPAQRRVFLYLPFEHSEDLADQELSVRLFRERANEGEYLKYAEAHRDVIRRFGRFPHRNAALGRASTPAELEYLAQPGAGF
jgi:uncharacterized protein (DUF924 family)